jgi:hypothetical protein
MMSPRALKSSYKHTSQVNSNDDMSLTSHDHDSGDQRSPLRSSLSRLKLMTATTQTPSTSSKIQIAHPQSWQ